MPSDLEAALCAVFSQAMVGNSRTVTVSGETFPVRKTAKQKLRQIDFRFEGREFRALEQSPNTKSRWAALARKGAQVMQFLEQGRYIAVIVDGRLHPYKRRSS
jgi:hypothetical protein